MVVAIIAAFSVTDDVVSLGFWTRLLQPSQDERICFLLTFPTTFYSALYSGTEGERQGAHSTRGGEGASFHSRRSAL